MLRLLIAVAVLTFVIYFVGGSAISSLTDARSRPTRFAVMTATRSPSERLISAGPSISSTDATADSGIAVVPR